MKKCGYPHWARKRKGNKGQVIKNKDKKQEQKKSVVIPYVKGLSEAVSRTMRKYGVKTAMRPKNKLRDLLVHPKDKLEEMDKGQGVYKIPCLSCPASYIGETGRRLGTRVNEHKKECDKIGKKSFTRAQKAEADRKLNKSAISDHVGRENHIIDWDGTRLVERENQEFTRKIRESIWIKKTPNNLNRDTGNYQLSGIYDAVIAKLATQQARPRNIRLASTQSTQ